MLLLYVTLITCSILPVCYGEEWIDPYEMSHTRNPSSPSIKQHKEQVPESQYQSVCTDTICISYYKRLVNVLLRSATRKSVDGLAYEGKLFIEIPVENYDVLKEFASSSGDVTMLQKIDEILSNVLLSPSQTSDRIANTILSWTDYVHIRFYNTNTLIWLSCIFVLLLSYKLLKANLTLGSVFKYLIFLGWVVDFSFRWISLLQEADIKNMVALKKFGSIPDNCDPKNRSLWKFIASFFSSSDDCKEYHQVLYKDHFYSVSPLLVFSDQVGIVIHTPASNIGQALGIFTKGILAHLPWGVNVILLPLLLVFAAIIICIGLTFWTNTSFGVNILGIFKFNFGNGGVHRGAARDTISGDNLSTLLTNLTHRNMVEDVRPTANTCSKINSEESNCSKGEVKINQGEKIECIKLPVDKLQAKDETKNADETKSADETKNTDETKNMDETKENVIHDGSGDSK